jgi:predicted RNA binding protein YcfA (HicA-like mRNA interferase family)
MRHPQFPRITLPIPVHGTKTLPTGTQMSILRDAGISSDEFNKRA